MFDDISNSNILLYAAKSYDRLTCLQSEFEEDYKTFRYIKRLLQRYRNTGVIKERLLLNHINLLQNVFGVEPSTRMLFLKINEKDYSALKTFLLFTSAMPDIVYGIDGKNIISADIDVDIRIVKLLRKV